jgi:hypothetical protein
VLAALASCSVADVDLAGKQCPCTDGFTCQPATNTCVPDHGNASLSCLGDEPGPLMYATELDTLDGWDIGAGTWAADAGGWARQSDATAKLAYAFPHSVTGSDYRIVSSFRATDGGTSSALEVSARVGDGGSSHQYNCNWDPFGGAFQIKYTFDESSNGVVVSTQLADFDPTATLTMEFEVRGDSLRCCIRELPAATLSGTDAQFSSGHPGLKTYLASGAYDYFHVFEPAP